MWCVCCSQMLSFVRSQQTRRVCPYTLTRSTTVWHFYIFPVRCIWTPPWRQNQARHTYALNDKVYWTQTKHPHFLSAEMMIFNHITTLLKFFFCLYLYELAMLLLMHHFKVGCVHAQQIMESVYRYYYIYFCVPLLIKRAHIL